ncbi:hypothetical protein PU683_00355 [Kosakonia cowanii]|uniref:hypothetical protein n=1 Tax=Kosakonia cowanii TaxID=208223 RepID=UPI0023F62B82|nr:hypothetical protein [Kosakonia cowanii]MDF7757980.1 hypothetical protein [Kosakonia cowanii]
MFKRLSAIVFVSLMGASAVQAEELRAVDVTKFDVAGVKTGMDYDEVVKAITTHFNVPASALQVDKYPQDNLVTGNKQPKFVGYEKEGVKLQVYFEGRVPVDAKHPLAASMITYELPWSTVNKEAMEKAAVEKYGPASNAPYSTPMVWCKEPGKQAGMACSSTTQQAVLKLSNTSLELDDPVWREARIKFMDSKQTRTPGF